MRKQFRCLVFIILPVITHAPQPGVEITQAYSGSIDDKFKVGMEITSTGQNLTGRYRYHDKLDWLSLSGTIRDSVVVLTERERLLLIDPSSQRPYSTMQVTGTFEGIIQSDSSIVGTWRNAEGTKSFPFVLHKERFDFRPGSIVIESRALPHKKDCERYPMDSITKIKDKRLSTYVFNKLNAFINESTLRAVRNSPCRDWEEGSMAIRVLYNKNNILSCLKIFSEPPYYSTERSRYPKTTYSNYDLRTGDLIEVTTLFKPQALSKVKNHIITQLAEKLEEATQEWNANEDLTFYQNKGFRVQGEGLLKGEKLNNDLYEFTLSDEALIFHVNWYYPNYNKYDRKLRPLSDVTIPYKDLLLWIDPKGALGFLLKK
jgi:hypothetical protein